VFGRRITRQLSLGQPQVSKHLRVLRRAGIVEAQPLAQQRIYGLQSAPFQELEAWLGTFQPTWEDRLDALEWYLHDLQTSRRSTTKKKP
jgi:DNA-binding transcriptional ArsR family regulator